MATIVGAPDSARASGFAAARFGGELGNVTAHNPTALYYNPAGIGFSSGTSVYLDGTLALRHATWEHSPSPAELPDPPGAEGSNSGKASLFNVFGGPMAGVTTRLGNLALGASFSVPFGGRAQWNKNERFANSAFPLAADGVQRWSVTEGALTFIYGTVGAAYRFGPLSVGVTGNIVHSSVKSTQAKSFHPDGITDTSREGRDTIDVTGVHGSIGVGGMAEVLEGKLWLAASYQSQPGFGAQRLKGTLNLDFQGGQVTTPITFDQALPDITRFGARYRASDTVELRLFGDFTRWSVMQTQCLAREGQPCQVDETGADPSGNSVVQNIRRRWRDTWGIHAGTSYWASPGAQLFTGIAFETAATPDETLQPDLPDANNIALAGGGRFEIARLWFVGASYTHIQYLNRDNTGKSQLANAALPTKWPDGGGKYTQWIGVFNANVEKQF